MGSPTRLRKALIAEKQPRSPLTDRINGHRQGDLGDRVETSERGVVGPAPEQLEKSRRSKWMEANRDFWILKMVAGGPGFVKRENMKKSK